MKKITIWIAVIIGACSVFAVKNLPDSGKPIHKVEVKVNHESGKIYRRQACSSSYCGPFDTWYYFTWDALQTGSLVGQGCTGVGHVWNYETGDGPACVQVCGSCPEPNLTEPNAWEYHTITFTGDPGKEYLDRLLKDYPGMEEIILTPEKGKAELKFRVAVK